MKEKINENNFYERGVLLNLTQGTYQGRKKLPNNMLKELPKEIVRAVYDLFEEDFTKILKEIMAFDADTRAVASGKKIFMDDRKFMAADFPIDGVYYILGEDVGKVINYLDQRKKEREELIKEPVKKYLKAIDKFAEKYPELYQIARTKYPSVEEFEKKFHFNYQIFQMTMPNKKLNFISPSIYKKEMEKIKSAADSVKNEVVNTMWTEILDYTRSLAKQSLETKPNQKTFNTIRKVINEIETTYSDFIERDDFLGLIEKIKKVLVGVDADVLRGNDSFKEEFGKKVKKLMEEVKVLPDMEMKRSIEF